MPLDPLDREHFEASRVAAAAALAERAPRPARVGNVLIGSASWTDPTLVKSGLFYPPSARTAEARLRYYASQFPLVEVDSSYYALPSRRAAELWVERTPDDFVFNVKAYGSMTGHPIELRALPKDVAAALPERLAGKRRAYPRDLGAELVQELEDRFVDALQPLTRAGKLGAVLLQLPPWFTATRGNARRIEAYRERLADLPLAVELRHPSWLADDRRPRLMKLLGDNRLTYVGVDTPQGRKTSMPDVLEVTCPSLAMVRFHGRNRQTWDARTATAAERFDYIYVPDELRPWAERVAALGERAELVHALFNNCTYHAAQLNGYDLAALLAEGSPNG